MSDLEITDKAGPLAPAASGMPSEAEIMSGRTHCAPVEASLTQESLKKRKPHRRDDGWPNKMAALGKRGDPPTVEGMDSSDGGLDSSDADGDSRDSSSDARWGQISRPGQAGLLDFQQGKCPNNTWAASNLALDDGAMYDPMLEDETGPKLQPEQVQFLRKYFVDPFFLPTVLDKISEEHPVPDIVMEAVSKKMDTDITDMMAGKMAVIAKEHDKSFLAIASRIATAMGPITELWSAAREARMQEQPINSEAVCRLLEKSMVALGQANSCILFQRRKAVLGKFFRDHKKANEIVRKNHAVFQTSEDLFGVPFHEALYRKAKGSKHLKEARKELEAPRQRKGRGGMQYKGSRKATFTYQSPLQAVDPGNKPTTTTAPAGTAQPFRGRPFARGRGNGQRRPATKARYSNFRLSNGFRFVRQYGLGRNSHLKNTNKLGLISTKAGTSRGSTGKTCRELGANQLRPVGPSGSKRVHNTMDGRSSTGGRTKNPKVFRPGSKTDERGNTESLGERGHRRSEPLQGAVRRVPLSTTEKRRYNKTRVQSQATEQVYSVRTFQDGRFTSGDRYDPNRNLVHKTRPEGCIPNGPHGAGDKEVPPFSLGGQVTPVQKLPVWASTSTEGIHQDNEASGGTIAQDGGEDGGVSRRHDLLKHRPTGIAKADKISGLVVGEVRLSDKLGEIADRANAGHTIPGVLDRRAQHENQSTTGQTAQYCAGMQGTKRVRGDDSAETGNADRKAGSGGESSSSSTAVLSQTAEVQNKSAVGRRPELRDSGETTHGVQRRIAMVVGGITGMEWPQHNPVHARPGDHHRCFQEGLGSTVPGTDDAGAVVQAGEPITHKRTRDDGSPVCDAGVRQGCRGQTHTHEAGQCSGSDQYKQDGRHQVRTADESNTADVDILPTETDHTYCRIPTRGAESSGRRTIQSVPRLVELAVGPRHFPGVEPIVGTTNNGLVCRQTEQAGRQLCQLETGPRSSGDGRIHNEVVSRGLCISSILHDKQMSGKSDQGRNRTGDDHTSLAGPSVVQPVTVDGSRLPETIATRTISSEGTERRSTSTSDEQHVNTSGLEGLREGWRETGFSEAAIDLLGKSRRKGTQSVYQGAWNKWLCWCDTRSIDPLQAPVAEVVNFLSSKFTEGAEYATLNGYRSAISAFHSHVEGNPIGQHPVVRQFMRGVFNERTPQPRYAETWDVDKLLQFFATGKPNMELTDKELSAKMVTLLALTTAARVHEIQKIDPATIEDYGDSILINMTALTKTRRPGKPANKIRLTKFEEAQLDVVECVRTYLKRTRSWRNTEETKGQLCLALVGEHKPVSAATVSRWIKNCMEAAGVDTEKFKAHSVRGAATSKAADMGVPVEAIMQRANWARATTFRRFYHRDIPKETSFETVVLKQKISKL